MNQEGNKTKTNPFNLGHPLFYMTFYKERTTTSILMKKRNSTVHYKKEMKRKNSLKPHSCHLRNQESTSHNKMDKPD